MQRAEKLFHIESWDPRSPFVDRIWRTPSVSSSAFISVAASHWEIVIWRHAGYTHVTTRGPETKATEMPVPMNADFFGVQFKLGAFMPGVSLPALVDRASTVTSRAGNTIRLGDADWEMPSYENVDVLLERLARTGLIVADPLVQKAITNQSIDLSRRSVERRVRRATGLTLSAIEQIDRAHRAAAMLDVGATISDVVIAAGYADQAHLTRSLKRFIGQTPGQIYRDAP